MIANTVPPPVNKIQFTKNWNNKLFCKYFTQTHKASKENETVYAIDTVHEIVLETADKRAVLGTAKVVAKVRFALSNVTETVARIDMGSNAKSYIDTIKSHYHFWCQESEMFDLVLFEYQSVTDDWERLQAVCLTTITDHPYSSTEISFNQNWNNKLFCKAFTTLRLHSAKKYKKNDIHNVVFNPKNSPSKILGTAKIVAVKTLLLSEVNEFIAHLDTAYNIDGFKNIVKGMYGKTANLETQKFDLVTYVYQTNTVAWTKLDKLKLFKNVPTTSESHNDNAVMSEKN
jgi:hypothetical protein